MEFKGTGVNLLWNKGVAALCDRRFPDEFPDGKTYVLDRTFASALWSRKIPKNLIPDPARHPVRRGELVWVRISWLGSFVEQVLSAAQGPFTLVTADSDSCVPSELGSLAQSILECSKIDRWYTQNYDGTVRSTKLLPLPIGIDFHTINDQELWGERRATPLEQEELLLSIKTELPPLHERIREVYVDFGWQRCISPRHPRFFRRLKGTWSRESRRRIVRKLRGNSNVHFQDVSLPRSAMWRTRGKFTFVLSPHGAGLDCHRTWEALALGHIVLVPSSSLDALYSGLPVIPLKGWNEITAENLEKWWGIYGREQGTKDILTNTHWIAQMRSRTAERKVSASADCEIGAEP